ncbi:MAG: SCP2 sterol-binding domain-containing protein [Desulfatiglandales bacterium]
MKLDDHPTVKWYRERLQDKAPKEVQKIEAAWVKKLVLDSGADDVGIVEIDRPELADHRDDILAAYPNTKALVSIVCRLNRDNIRSTSRSASDLEFLKGFEGVNRSAHRVERTLGEKGVRCMVPGSSFPMDLYLWPGKMWPVSHKTVAEAAGMGLMGRHRVLIHPRFGSFVALGTILMDGEVTAYDSPIDFNPCIECGLCTAVCPVGAIGKDGQFSFVNCMTHNYRDRLGGFTDWVERLAGSGSAVGYRKKVSDRETVSMWQSLCCGISNKSSYCLAVCPAGEDLIGSYLEDRKGYIASVVRPLQERQETVFVVPGSDAEAHVPRHFPQKTIKRVGNGLRPDSIRTFLESLPLFFQRGQSEGLDATYHFTFTGAEDAKSTVIIRDKNVEVKDGHVGTPNLRVEADSQTWVSFLVKETNILWAMLRRKVKVKGSPALLKAFAKCFPS